MGMTIDHVDPHAKGHDAGRQDCSCDDCGAIETERNRYFHGKFMTPRDFRQEQAYVVSRQRLHNRALHGWGVVCGLGVIQHPGKGCEGSVIVQTGLAIDCCGRELIVECDRVLDLELQIPADADNEAPPSDLVASRPRTSKADEARPDGVERRWICLRYKEEKIEWVPALYEGGEDCDPDHREANRIREVAVIEVCRDLPPGCWPEDAGSAIATCRDDCGDHVATACLRPDCTCDELVAIALNHVRPCSTDPLQHRDTRPTATSDGRRSSDPCHRHQLATRWGGRHLGPAVRRRSPGARLRSEDRGCRGQRSGREPLHPDGAVRRDPTRRRVPALGPRPSATPRGRLPCSLHDRSRVPRRGGQHCGERRLRLVEMRLLLDCLGEAVDGDHLRGELPSGDGVPGGTFESWFRSPRAARRVEEARRHDVELDRDPPGGPRAESGPTAAGPCPCGCVECEDTCCSLDCLVQPRFFHGQLLTDRDLNALLR